MSTLLFKDWCIKQGFYRDRKGFEKKGTRYTYDQVLTIYDAAEQQRQAKERQRKLANYSSQINEIA